MTKDRQHLAAQELAARSIAALEDLESIERKPLAEIKADLTRLGIDPNDSIARAWKLAGKRSTPADRLLSRLDDADAVDAEIEALENADIGEIQGTVPSGTATSITADAKRRAGTPSNVTGLRRSRRRVIGWGGSMIGLAACLLLFVVTRPDQLYQAEQPVVEMANDIAAPSEARTTGSALIEEASEALQRARQAESDEAADQDVTLDRELAFVEPRQPTPTEHSRALSAPEVSEALETLTSRAATSPQNPNQNQSVNAEPLAKAQSPEKRSEPLENEVAEAVSAPTPSHLPKAKPAIPVVTSEESVVASAPKAVHIPKAKPANLAASSETVTALGAETAQTLTGAQTSRRSALTTTTSALVAEDLESVQAEFRQSDFSAAETNIAGVADAGDLWSDARAVLIVDQNEAPLALKTQAESLPKGDLVHRLDEAQRLAGDGNVVALVTVVRDGQEVDAALSYQSRSSLADIDAIAGFSATPQAHSDGGFEFIELPIKP